MHYCVQNVQEIYVQDEQAQRESQKANQQAQSKQAMVKKVLEDQLSQIQQERNAAKEQKKKEAAELKDSIRQYEEEEFQKWQQHKEQQAKTKQMYSQQASQIHTVLVPIRESHSDKSRHTKSCIVSAQLCWEQQPPASSLPASQMLLLEVYAVYAYGETSAKFSACNAYIQLDLYIICWLHVCQVLCMS